MLHVCQQLIGNGFVVGSGFSLGLSECRLAHREYPPPVVGDAILLLIGPFLRPQYIPSPRDLPDSPTKRKSVQTALSRTTCVDTCDRGAGAITSRNSEPSRRKKAARSVRQALLIGKAIFVAQSFPERQPYRLNPTLSPTLSPRGTPWFSAWKRESRLLVGRGSRAPSLPTSLILQDFCRCTVNQAPSG